MISPDTITELIKRSDEFQKYGVGPGRVLVSANLGGNLRKVPLSDVQHTLDAQLGDCRLDLANALLVKEPRAEQTAVDAFDALETAVLELAWLNGNKALVNRIVNKGNN